MKSARRLNYIAHVCMQDVPLQSAIRLMMFSPTGSLLFLLVFKNTYVGQMYLDA